MRKFYSAHSATWWSCAVFAAHEARRGGRGPGAARGISASNPTPCDLLVEALGADMARIAVEIEKLALYAGQAAR